MSEDDISTFGVHYMVDGYQADPVKLADKTALRELLNDLPTKLGMHTIADPQVVEVGELNRKDPGGVSGFVLIAESHISFHTFSKRGFVTIDVYTCQDHIDAEKLTKMFVSAFKITDYDEKVIERGTKYPVEDIY
jgi:S-adenosylmethionine decarboxylase